MEGTESVLAAAAAMVSKSIGLEMRFSEDEASEMLEVTLVAEVEFTVSQLFDMLIMLGDAVCAICCCCCDCCCCRCCCCS